MTFTFFFKSCYTTLQRQNVVLKYDDMMPEYCIIMSHYDIKVEDVTVESHNRAVLFQDI